MTVIKGIGWIRPAKYGSIIKKLQGNYPDSGAYSGKLQDNSPIQSASGNRTGSRQDLQCPTGCARSKNRRNRQEQKDGGAGCRQKSS